MSKITKEEAAKIRSDLTSDMKQIIYQEYDGRCIICGYRTGVSRKNANGNIIHHIKPVCYGGQSTPDNLVLLCPNHHKEVHDGVITKAQLDNAVKDKKGKSLIAWDVRFIDKQGRRCALTTYARNYKEAVYETIYHEVPSIQFPLKGLTITPIPKHPESENDADA